MVNRFRCFSFIFAVKVVASIQFGPIGIRYDPYRDSSYRSILFDNKFLGSCYKVKTKKFVQKRNIFDISYFYMH